MPSLELGRGHEEARIYHPYRQCGGGVAACIVAALSWFHDACLFGSEMMMIEHR